MALNMTYMSAMTRGLTCSGAMSVASASPAVCVVCSPAPTNQERECRGHLTDPNRTVRVAREDQQRERHDRQTPNCSSVPIQM